MSRTAHILFLAAALLMPACGRPDFGKAGADEVVVYDGPEEGDGDAAQGGSGGDPVSDDEASPDVGSPDAPNRDYAVTSTDGGFELQLYEAARSSGRDSFVVAPHGVARALVIGHAAGAGDSPAIEPLLREYVGDGDLYGSFAALDAALQRSELLMLPAVWGDSGADVSDALVEHLGAYHGLGVRLLGFSESPGDARNAVNNWYTEATDGRISNVVPPRFVDQSTRVLVTDVTHFSGEWSFGEFAPEQTMLATFHGLRSDIEVPMMWTESTFFSLTTEALQLAVLPYTNGTSLIVIVPEDLELFEERLSPELLDRLVAEASLAPLRLGLPKASLSMQFDLRELNRLGAQPLLSPQWLAAEGSGLAVQRTRLELDERGLTLDAGVNDGDSDPGTDPASAPPGATEFVVDRPFFVALQDGQTSRLLFIGRIGQL